MNDNTPGKQGLRLSAAEALFIAAVLIGVTYAAVTVLNALGDPLEFAAGHVSKVGMEKVKTWLEF